MMAHHLLNERIKQIFVFYICICWTETATDRKTGAKEYRGDKTVREETEGTNDSVVN